MLYFVYGILITAYTGYSQTFCFFSGGGLVELKNLRIPGVLQRLALTYFVVATLQVFFAGRGQTLLPIEVIHSESESYLEPMFMVYDNKSQEGSY